MDSPETFSAIKNKKTEILNSDKCNITYPLKFSIFGDKQGLCPEEFFFNRDLTSKSFHGFITNGHYQSSSQSQYTILSFHSLSEAILEFSDETKENSTVLVKEYEWESF